MNSPRGPRRPLRTALLLLLLLAAGGVLFLLYAFFWPNIFPGVSEKAVYVSRGQAFSQIVDSLARQGVIRDRDLFLLVARMHGGASRVQVGKYLFRSGVSNEGIFQSLRTGTGAVIIPVTLREGLTVRRQARVLARSLGIDSAAFVRIAVDTSFARSLGLQEGTLEGYLMPDTYSFSWQPDERDVVRRLAGQFSRFFADSLRERAAVLGLSIHQVMTMASLVEGETHLPEERPVVAGVYYNRLRRGMRLQADPTIQYLLESGPRRLFYSDLVRDSPYNTYRHAGLPPGPVNNPGRASVMAALYPAQHQYLYFVANGQGGHWFSASYDTHVRNVRLARKLRRMAEQARQAPPPQ